MGEGMTVLVFFISVSGCITTPTDMENEEIRRQFISNYHRFCPYNSFCSLPAARALPAGYTSCCQQCSCGDKCKMFNICCPDKEWPDETPQHFYTSYASCYYPYNKQYDRKSLEGLEKPYLMIDKCPEMFSDVEVKRKCENGSDVNLKEAVPVVEDSEEKEIYKNEFCARCHDVEKWTQWETVIKVSTSNFMRTVNNALETTEDIFSSIRSNQADGFKQWKVIFKAPFLHIISRYSCVVEHKGKCDTTSTTIANMSTATLAVLCRAYTIPYDIYNNIYCRVCQQTPNQVESDRYKVCKSYSTQKAGPLVAILRYEDIKTVESLPEVCKPGEVLDHYQGTCRQEFCSKLQIRQDGHCINVLHSINNCFAAIIVRLTPLALEFGMTNQEKLTLANAFVNQFSVANGEMYTDTVGEFTGNGDLYSLLIFFRLQMTITGNNDLLNIYTRISEQSIYNYILEHQTATLKVDIPDNVVFDDEGNFLDLKFNETLDKLYENKYADFSLRVSLLVRKQLFCQQVLLKSSEVVDHTDRLYLKAPRRLIYQPQFQRIQGDDIQYLICSDDYLGNTNSRGLAVPVCSTMTLVVSLWSLMSQLLL